jgi:hypothetical protein
VRERKGLKSTGVPLLYEANYPEQSQVGYLVKGRRRGRPFFEIFNFSRYPSEEECFKAAAARAKTIHNLYPPLTRREYAQIKRKNWRNKIVGVRRLIKKSKGIEYEFWEASWSPRVGVVKKRLFSVNKYGNKEAERMALKTREEGLASMRE